MAGLNEAEEAFGYPPGCAQMAALAQAMFVANRMADPLPVLRGCMNRLAELQGDAYTAALDAAFAEIAPLFSSPDPLEALTKFFHAAAAVGEARAYLRILDFHTQIVAARQEAAGNA